ncbi:MAG: exodeoxyribonuclease VII small subunit [Paludibacteraceae bacterium]|nr:exodeoxyribonuclease VII small subunit [Paludibacteraceae bacterium]
MKYEEKIGKLEQIVNDIESGKLSVDMLSEKVKEASLLIKECREMLTKVQNEVNNILTEAEKE